MRSGQYPFDIELGVAQGMSTGISRVLVKLCARLPFAEACEILGELAQVQIGVTKAWHETQAAGLRALPAMHPKPTTAAAFQAAQCVSIAMDGCKVNVRGEGWKEVKVGTISEVFAESAFTVNRHNDTIYQTRATDHSYVAHLGGPEGFGTKLLTEAQARDWSNSHQNVVLGDGAPWIWNLAAVDYPTAAHVVDWYHAKQHLHVAADVIFPPASEQAHVWVEDMANHLYAGQALEIADRLETAASIAKPETASLLRTEAGYFENNHERMQYRDFQLAQLPIGSGTVESGAKQTKHRVSAAGMRWSRDGLEHRGRCRRSSAPACRSSTPRCRRGGERDHRR